MNPWFKLFYVTRALLMAAQSRDIYLFGSTARSLREDTHDGIFLEDFSFGGNDFDLAVTVTPDVYANWNWELTRILECDADCKAEHDTYHDCKDQRFELALKLLGIGTWGNVTPLYGWLATLNEITRLDIHLMPENWRNTTADIQADLPHRDPQFVSNIATDAILLSGSGTEDMPLWQNKVIEPLRQETFRLIGNTALQGLTA